MNKYVKVEDIMGYINTDNRGNCDYFIVDKIEELCNSDKTIDLADHDKQIRDETAEEFKKLIYEMAYDTDVQFFSNDIMISIWGSSIDKITEQMKGEQNE